MVSADWPPAVPDDLAASVRITNAARDRPHYNVLIDMAPADKRIDNVLHWYKRMRERSRSTTPGWGWYGSGSYADRVAQAVAASHPQKALEIYHQRLDVNLKTASGSAYEACASYLEKMRPIMQSLGQGDQWTKLLENIRDEYRRRPRFMEVLDRLDGRTIVQPRRARGKRR